MPYHVEKKGNSYLIIREADGKVVGRSKTKKDANISIAYRMKGEKK